MGIFLVSGIVFIIAVIYHPPQINGCRSVYVHKEIMGYHCPLNKDTPVQTADWSEMGAVQVAMSTVQ